MDKKLVTIIVPVYKVEKYLADCIESLIAQTYKNLEIILVDDGSPDRSPIICDQYAEKDIRIKVIHKKNGGLSSARNAGIVIAKGEYITFCDSDDILLPQTISRYIEVQRKYKCDIVSCESCFYNGEVATIIERYHKKSSISIISGIDYLSGFFNYTTDCSVCNKMFKTEMIRNYKFEEGKTNEDLLFLYDVFRECGKIVHINEGLYLYRLNEESISHTFNANSLNVYYNAVFLHKRVKKEFPSLEKFVFNYIIYNGYNICIQILNFDKTHSEPFSKVYIEFRKYLFSSLIRIVKSKKYSIKKIFKFIYLILGAPCYNIYKRYYFKKCN